ncbi:hypothetical protein PR048_017815 [Dryococelus australis]|uniref:Uncharacterized protein n=1 Tax=Dryococelus australis TaxID=614101 RepID=A0ABQ9HAM9_9NEOP|nr:hypothetical protein PR048_017815 [Dryococelus australis]
MTKYVLSLLTLVASDTYLNDIGRYELASKAWEILECIHTNYGLLYMIMIFKEMVNTAISDDVQKYDGLVKAMEKDKDNLTPAVVKVKLLLEERRIKRDEDQKVNMEGAKAMAVKQLLNKYPNFDSKREFDYKSRDQRNFICFSCFEPGYIARFCTKVARQENTTKTDDQK